MEAFDKQDSEIPIKWSNAIDEHGNIPKPTGLLGLEDSVALVMRRDDGEAFGETIIRMKHSFSSKMLEVVYDPTVWGGEDG